MTAIDDIPFLPQPTPCEIPTAYPVAHSSPPSHAAPSAHSSEGLRSPVSSLQSSVPSIPSPISNLQSQIPLARARAIAEHVADRLRPYCHQIEIAGSIRRGRPTCGDIDLVILPADRDALLARVRQSCTIKTSGDLNTIAVMSNGVQLDIFLAKPPGMDLFTRSPGTWGTLLLCRTGSKQFNIWLADQAKARGLHWNPYRGICQGGSLTGQVIAAETEQEIFAALNLDWIPPEARER